MTIYDFEVEDNEGNMVSLSDYKNKVILIVNSATECGFTPQYEWLEKLYANYKDKGFIILDFPCNQFGGQAPGSTEEIVKTCRLKFAVEYPIFAKIDVNGDNEIPLYTYLKEKQGFSGFGSGKSATAMKILAKKNDWHYKDNPDIKWNFTKFLVDREGNVVERFEPTIDEDVIDKKIQELL